MPDTFTPVLTLTQPEVGASDSTWGTKLNADLATLDALFAGTGTGTIIRRDASDNAATVGITVAKAAGNGRWVQFLTGALARWFIGANTTAEGGANAGSDYVVQRYNDAGTLLGTSLSVSRATGQITFETTPQVGANAVRTVANDGDLRTLIGAVGWWVGTGDPAGGFWLTANGRALDRTTYAALFAVTGTTYGAGNGTTTFNIPNVQERVIVGRAETAGSLIPQFNATIIGNTFGEGRHTLTVAEHAQHAHPAFINDQGHNHGTNAWSNAGGSYHTAGGGDFGWGPASNSAAVTGVRVWDGATLDTTGASGSNTPHNNVQPSIVLTPVIRVQ